MGSDRFTGRGSHQAAGAPFGDRRTHGDHSNQRGKYDVHFVSRQGSHRSAKFHWPRHRDEGLEKSGQRSHQTWSSPGHAPNVAAGAAVNLYSGLFLRKQTHRTFSLVVAGLDCLLIPWGTVLGVFTIVVLTRDSVIAGTRPKARHLRRGRPRPSANRFEFAKTRVLGSKGDNTCRSRR